MEQGGGFADWEAAKNQNRPPFLPSLTLEHAYYTHERLQQMKDKREREAEERRCESQ